MASPYLPIEYEPAEIQESVLLASYTTLRIGGPARFFCRITRPEQLLEAVSFARRRSLRLFILGGGSNIFVADAGFDGLVLHLEIASPTRRTGDRVAVAAGTHWDTFVRDLCEQGISGVECLAGIPGLVGGSPIQNIGAYGQEAAQTIDSVQALDLDTLRFVTLAAGACAFGYRSSLFNTTACGRYIVTGVTFRFDPAARPKLTYPDLARHFAGQLCPSPIEVYHAVRSIRQAKGMLLVEGDPDSRGAGSFFKNPIVPSLSLSDLASTLSCDPKAIPHWPTQFGTIKLSAAWLVERAGFPRGFRLGAAGISSRHTLALINRSGSATSADICLLRDLIRNAVRDRFRITLEQEPVQLG